MILVSPVRSPLKQAVYNPLLKIGSTAGGGAPALPQAGAILEDFDARSITPQADNTNLVGGWPGTKGVSGAGTVGGTPKYRNAANGVGGLPAVEFAGGSDCIDYGQPAAIKAAIDARVITKITVYLTIGTPGFGCIVSHGGSDSGSFQYADGVNAGRFGAPANGSNIPYPDQTTFGFSSVVTDAAFPLGGIPGVEYTGANGSTLNTYVGALSGVMGTGVLAFGNVVSGSGVPFTGRIARHIIWGVALTPTEVMQAYVAICAEAGQVPKFQGQADYRVFDGDSITASVAVTSDITETYPWKAAQTMGLAVGQWSCLAIGGADFAGVITPLAPTRITNLPAVVGRQVKVAVFEWRNQAGADPGPRNNANAYCTATRSANVLVHMSTSTSASNDPDANRTAYNASWDAAHANVDGYCDLHTDTFIGVSGAEAANPTYFADGVHPTALGCTQMDTKITPTFAAM